MKLSLFFVYEIHVVLPKGGGVIHDIPPWHRGCNTALYLPVRFHLL